MSQLRRPRPGEDDLDEMMRQFEQQNLAPAASAVNKRTSEDSGDKGSSGGAGAGGSSSNKKQKSLFSQRRKKDNVPSPDTGNDKENNSVKFQLPSDSNDSDNVLSEIVEKNVSGPIKFTLPAMPSASLSKPFPDVVKIGNVNPGPQPQMKKRSLFAQQFQQMKRKTGVEGGQPQMDEDIENKSDAPEDIRSSIVNVDSFGDQSRIVTGSGLERPEDVGGIHDENLQVLKQMTEQEILEEKEKFSKMLEPKLLEFLKNRRRPKANEGKVSREDNEQTKLPTKTEETKSDGDKPSVQYPGLDKVQVEADKLSWAGDLPEVAPGQLSGFTARFGFGGELLRPDSEVPVTAGLHHHGAEQQHPGYSVEEMMTLARSSNNRQRQLGLELLEAVLHSWWAGQLDSALDQNLVQELVRAGLVTVARLSLDTGEAGLAVAGLRCLVALLCCREEERLLDWLVDTAQPSLAPELDTGPEQREAAARLSDHELVTRDVVAGLVRMEVVARCDYLLRVERYSDPALVTAVLAVMTRLARHSRQVAASLAPLLGWLLEHHHTHPLTVKLTRLLCAWDRELATQLLAQHNIAQLVAEQLAAGVDSLYATQTSVECHKLWCQLLHWDLAAGHQLWSQLYPVMVTRLLLLYNTDQLTSTSCVGGWLVTAAGHQLASCPDLVQLLESCVTKWLAQLARVEEPPGPTFLQLVAVTCCTLARHYRAAASTIALDRLQQFLNTSLLKFLDSSFYSRCVSSLSATSTYLTRHRPSSRHPPCLPAVGVVLQGGAPPPLLPPASPELLLVGVTSLASTLLTLTASSPLSLDTTAPQVAAYLAAVSALAPPPLAAHWLSRPSAQLLCCLLTLYSPHLPAQLQLSAALAVSTLLPARDAATAASILSRFLFSPALLSSLAPPPASPAPLPTPSGQTGDTAAVVSSTLAQLATLAASYTQLLGLPAPGSNPPARATWPASCGPLLARDWPYAPLLALHHATTGPRQLESCVTPQLVRHCLAWLALLPPSAAITATWTRLATLLLCPGSLALAPDTSCLLHRNLANLLTHGTLDMSLAVPGNSQSRPSAYFCIL